MTKIIEAKNGYKAIKMKTTDLMAVEPGAMGICDRCGQATFDGYYIPVLNSFYCEECFKHWEDTMPHYKEDEPYEKAHLESMVKRLKAKGIM